MMIFRRFLCLTILFLSLSAFGQEMTVKDFTVAASDITASVYSKPDVNGNKCALVKVSLPLQDVKFEGGVLHVEYKTGEYWVYMGERNRQLQIKHDNFHPLMVTFADFGVEKLQAATTYKLMVQLPNSSVATNKEQTLVINYKPTNAIVLIDNKHYSGVKGKVTATLPVMAHNYIITADGYDPETGTVNLKETSPTTINVELVKIRSNTTPADVTNTTSFVNNVSTTSVSSNSSQPVPNIPAEYTTPIYNNIDKALLLSASQGDSQAQYKIGEEFYYGKNSTEKNYKECVKWFRKSAEQGDADGMNDYGMMFVFGHGVNKDYKQAYKWLRKSADKGQANAMANLGRMYYNGLGVKQDYSIAFDLYKQSAERGNSYGQYNLGLMYFGGTGVAQSDTEALKWIQKSAEQEYLEAMSFLANMYENGFCVTKNLLAAIKWYKKAAALNDTIAKNALKRLGETW